jgi:protein arginine kinase activator
MICEHCKQRHATVTITQVQNGTKVERHYCDVCAPQFHPFHFDVQEEPISLHQLMSNWFGIGAKHNQQSEQHKKQQVSCPSCGFTYRQFLKVGKFGCGACYETFRQQLPSVLERLQADVKHVGVKQSNNEAVKIQEQLEHIKQQMQLAIEEEHFEVAAKLRDEARALKQRLQAGEVNEL